METKSTMRTDISRVRHLGSARSGTQHLWHMRLTSLALVPLTLGFVWLVLSLLGKDYQSVRAALAAPVAAVLMLLFTLTGVFHMKLGMQTIIEDYVHGEGAKTAAVTANIFFCCLVGAACVFAIFRISFV